MTERDLLCYQESLLECVERLYAELPQRPDWELATIWWPPLLLDADGSLSSRLACKLPWNICISRRDLAHFPPAEKTREIWKSHCHHSWILTR